jgi:pyruvate/oxaloacetate carboxyltransferase
MNDFDCVYVMSQLKSGNNVKVVQFENKKKRGNVAASAAYCYSTEPGISYAQLLATVQPVDPDEVDSIRIKDELISDSAIIDVAVSAIKSGIKTKMQLAITVSERAKISNRNAIKVIEKYTGTDPDKHYWYFKVGERGAKLFEVLEGSVPLLVEEDDLY